MKYTYKLQHKYIPKLKNIGDMMLNPTEDSDEFDDIVIGGIFIPDDHKSSINLTSEFLIRDNQDKVNQNNNYLASFFGDNIMDNNLSSYDDKINYIGKWSYNIDANANVYYVIVDNSIRKIIFSKPIEPSQMVDPFGVIYIIEDNGNMVYCQPDENDILFDNLPEAKKYINEQKELFSPLT